MLATIYAIQLTYRSCYANLFRLGTRIFCYTDRMTDILTRLASAQGRRDDAPNKILAAELVRAQDTDSIAELAANLTHADINIQSDCIKTLYEIGFLAPELLRPHVLTFLEHLSSKNNRMVWGCMYALGCIAHLEPEIIYAHLEKVQKALAEGSVITVDNAVLVLAHVAARVPASRAVLIPQLYEHLRTCRMKEMAQHAEKILPAMLDEHAVKFRVLLESRLRDASPAQTEKIKKVIKRISC